MQLTIIIAGQLYGIDFDAETAEQASTDLTFMLRENGHDIDVRVCESPQRDEYRAPPHAEIT